MTKLLLTLLVVVPTMLAIDLLSSIINEGTRALLEANGLTDAKVGTSMEAGWKDVAEQCGFPVYSRTPAREAYEDGYYSYRQEASR